MAKEVLCPICGAAYNLADEQVGKKVRCKKCEHAFTAGGEKKRRREEDDEDEDDEGVQDAPRGRSRAKKGRGRDEKDDKPKKTKSIEEQAKPRGSDGPKMPMSSIIITCVAVGVLLLCCGGGGLIFWVNSSSQPKPNQNPPVRPNPPNKPPVRR